MTNADERDFRTEAITLIEQRTYDKYALLDHLLSVFINQVGSPTAAAVEENSTQLFLQEKVSWISVSQYNQSLEN